MNIETVRDYCLSKSGATESFPFGDDTLVFKVGGKIFVLANLEGDWNTILLDGSIPDKEVLSWIDHSYELVDRK